MPIQQSIAEIHDHFLFGVSVINFVRLSLANGFNIKDPFIAFVRSSWFSFDNDRTKKCVWGRGGGFLQFTMVVTPTWQTLKQSYVRMCLELRNRSHKFISRCICNDEWRTEICDQIWPVGGSRSVPLVKFSKNTFRTMLSLCAKFLNKGCRRSPCRV